MVDFAKDLVSVTRAQQVRLASKPPEWWSFPKGAKFLSFIDFQNQINRLEKDLLSELKSNPAKGYEKLSKLANCDKQAPIVEQLVIGEGETAKFLSIQEDIYKVASRHYSELMCVDSDEKIPKPSGRRYLFSKQDVIDATKNVKRSSALGPDF